MMPAEPWGALSLRGRLSGNTAAVINAAWTLLTADTEAPGPQLHLTARHLEPSGPGRLPDDCSS